MKSRSKIESVWAEIYRIPTEKPKSELLHAVIKP